MARYFLEVAYKGTAYSGFQIQENANTIQAEVEKALKILLLSGETPSPLVERAGVRLTGSSRTDAGVHALQNYFHFDYEGEMPLHLIYKMNALLPADIAMQQVHLMHPDAHSRFDAVRREYEYRLYQKKDPFLPNLAFYYPYKLDNDLMQQASIFLLQQTDFSAFAKSNTQVKNFNCTIYQSQWVRQKNALVYQISANRFLRGMVRLLTASILQVGRKRTSLEEFQTSFSSLEKSKFSVPAHGLFLSQVIFPPNFFPHQ